MGGGDNSQGGSNVNTKRRDHLHSRLSPALVGAFLGGGAIAAVSVLLLSGPPSTATPDEAGPPVSVLVQAEPVLGTSAGEGCIGAQMVEPGEYESVQRTGSVWASWVIIPDSYEQIAPAPLYVLSVAGFTGLSDDLDLLRPAFEALDGVVLLTAAEAAENELEALIAEVTTDFCVDAQRVITSMVPLLGSPLTPEPEPAMPRDKVLAA